MPATHPLVSAAQKLRRGVNALSFGPPVAFVYNPLDYAFEPHREYLERFGSGAKRIVFFGMNPGPWGMTQTGIPFGEVAAARDWMRIVSRPKSPEKQHPKRPIEGYACARSEVSGRRLWGLFAERFDKPKNFFREHFVANYCPLVFLEDTGRNRTPDKLPVAESQPLTRLCDAHLRAVVESLEPEWVVGVGQFAEKRARTVLEALPNPPQVGTILHPSPASPAANRDWAGAATRQMIDLGLWKA
ncbi:MAG: uracil-DNA glycosylase family protein [Opitutales bacterium]